ncbi:YesL family protein [Clostridium sp. AF17-21AC]|nr:YesL family protein [Clostridium sp. AF17-21AC]
MTNNQDNKNSGRDKEPFLRRAMDAFGTMFALNICFVIGCIPIFTIGASFTALYAMCIRLQEDEEETVVSGFIHEFKRSFKQSTIAFLLLLVAVAVMLAEYIMIKRVTGFISTFYTFVLIIEAVLVALVVPFLFPLIARYNNALSITVRNAMVLSITYLWSWVKVVIAWFVPIFICVKYPVVFVSIWYMWLLLLFGAIAWGTTHTIRKIFRLNEQRIIDTAEKERKAAEEAAKEAESDESESVDEEGK